MEISMNMSWKINVLIEVNMLLCFLLIFKLKSPSIIVLIVIVGIIILLNSDMKVILLFGCH